MLRSVLLASVLSVTLLGMPGCNKQPPVSVALSHTAEILVVNRANQAENASTPWVKDANLNFPASLASQTQKYWVIFVDQTPCKPGPDPKNPLAYEGSKGNLPSCVIKEGPSAGNRDRHFRYALWTEQLGPLPPYEQTYARATCSPVCP